MGHKTGSEGSNFSLFRAITVAVISYLWEPPLPEEMVSVRVVIPFNGAM